MTPGPIGLHAGGEVEPGDEPFPRANLRRAADPAYARVAFGRIAAGAVIDARVAAAMVVDAALDEPTGIVACEAVDGDRRWEVTGAGRIRWMARGALGPIAAANGDPLLLPA